ncbi:MAG: transglycosylase SLT domain-containing protein [Deltaproteobacteria bacterium]|nr:transglycosylase SLT domain-containing protein [Deltaproteobacteria bacterium]
MANPFGFRSLTVGAVLSLTGFLVVSCSGVAVKGSSPGTPEPGSDPPGLQAGLEWTDLDWRVFAGPSGTGSTGPALDGDPSGAGEEAGGVAEGQGREDPGDKNGHSPDDVKEDENADQARLYDAIDFCQKSQDLWKAGRLDEAKKSLDQAYQSILDINRREDPEIAQQIDDLRFLISKRILEIYASRLNGVNGNYKEIPLVMNGYVEAEIKRFQTKDRDFFLQAYSRSGRYRPYIQEKLEEAGLPAELSWLPLIESGFKVRALSRSRALGLWQFIPSTGYKFGLRRNRWIDERMNVEKSTRAAIEYLKELHGIFGDWTTVLAAYNCGEGTVLREIRRQRINYLDDFWDLYGRLPRETARYVPRYLAVLHIIADPERYGFVLDGPDPPMAFEEVRIAKRVRLRDVARQIGVPEAMLVELNPELRYKVTPKGYSLRVPSGKGRLLLARLEKIPVYVPPKRRYVYHRVRRGETLSHIARRYHTSIRSIAKANGIVQRNFIRVGQKLKIPVR